MTDDKSGRQRLEEALLLYDRAYYDSFPVATEKYTHTRGFGKRMREALFQAPSQTENARSLGKRTVFMLLAAALMVAGAMGVTAIGERHGGFYLHSGGNFMELVSGGEYAAGAPMRIETVYCPTVPSAFRVTREHVTSYEVKYIWEDETGARIIFTQLLLGAKSTMDNENADLHIRYVGHLRLACSDKNGLKSFYWNDSGYSFSLVVPSAMPDAVCVELIRSACE